jgi:multicomponent K+:H+ antiporter subunit C
MELLVASAIAVLTSTGLWLALRRRTFEVIIGFTLVSYAVNLFIFAMGRPVSGRPPIIRDGLPLALDAYADPLPQALVLTAIVISFAMTAILLALALRSYGTQGSDHVDGSER